MWQWVSGWWVVIRLIWVSVVMIEFRCWWFLGLLVVVGEQRYGGWRILIWILWLWLSGFLWLGCGG